MNDVLIPDWIKREKAEIEAAELRIRSEERQNYADSLTVKHEGPEFWRQLLKELAVNVEALQQIGLRGELSPISRSEMEDAYRISVALIGVNPRQTYTDIFYMRGSATIRCWTLEGEAIEIPLCVRAEGGIGAYTNSRTALLTAERTAEYLVRRMMEKIRSSRNADNRR